MTLDGYIKDIILGQNKHIDGIKNRSDRFFILYGPPGAGKDTVRGQLLKQQNIKGIIRHTTRPKGEYETNGVHYHFHSDQSKINREYLKNWSLLGLTFQQHYYWEDAEEVNNVLENYPNCKLLLMMGATAGVIAMKKLLQKALLICIIPTSDFRNESDECIYRLKKRAREKNERLVQRIEIVKKEIKQAQVIADRIVYNPFVTLRPWVY